MKTTRRFFHKGIRSIGKPQAGEARFIHDAIVRQGRLRPIALPSLKDSITLSNSTRCIWRYRGRNYLSHNLRSYAVAQQAWNDVVALSEDEGAQALEAHPKKIVNGLEMVLGIPRPSLGIRIQFDDQPWMKWLIEDTPGEGTYYRFVPYTAKGKLRPTKAGIGYTSEKIVGDTISFPRHYLGQPVIGYGVYRGEQGKEAFVGSTAPDSFVYSGVGITASVTDLAKDLDLKAQETQYLHTFWYDDGAFQTEGAPSPVSPALPINDPTPLVFDVLSDGYWAQRGRIDIDLDALAVFGPCQWALDHPSEEAPLAAPGAPILSSDPIGNAWALSGASKPQWISGTGVMIADAAGAALQTEVPLGTPFDGENFPVRWDRIVLRNLSAMPTGAAKIRVIHGGTLPSIPSITPRVGMLNLDLTDHSIVGGEKILVYSESSPGVISHRCKTEMTRDLTPASVTNVWCEADHGDWTWGAETKKWTRDLLHIVLRDPAAVDLGAYGPYSHADIIEDGTLVQLTHALLGGSRQGTVRRSWFGLHVELSDSTGLEFLNVSGGMNGLKISYYPKNNHIKGRMLYRTGDTTEFLQVALVPLNQETYIDQVPTEALGQGLMGHQNVNGMLVQNDEPPASLRGVVNHHGIFYGISRNTVRWTLRGNPNAWPEVCMKEFPDTPLALRSFNQSLIVLCRRSIWRIDGDDPTALSISKTPANEGILAPRSVADAPGALIFLGDRGILAFDGHYTKCLTEEQIYPWQFFPARQERQDGTLAFGTSAGAGRIADTSRAGSYGWISALEDASFVDALAVDALWGLDTASMEFRASKAHGLVHDGDYWLYIPAQEEQEGHGTWLLHLNEPGTPLVHLGAQPIALVSDGGELFFMGAI